MKTSNEKHRVLDEEIVAANMRLYLYDKYDIEYDVENVYMVSKMIDGLTWFKGRAVSNEESFTVMADEFSETFRDDRYLGQFEEQLNTVSDEAFQGLWNEAEVSAKIKLPDYAFKNNYWSPDSKFEDLLNTEYVLTSCVVIIPENAKNEKKDRSKFHQYISACVENGIIPATFSLDYVDSEGNRSTKYFVNMDAGDTIPDEDMIGGIR